MLPLANEYLYLDGSTEPTGAATGNEIREMLPLISRKVTIWTWAECQQGWFQVLNEALLTSTTADGNILTNSLLRDGLLRRYCILREHLTKYLAWRPITPTSTKTRSGLDQDTNRPGLVLALGDDRVSTILGPDDDIVGVQDIGHDNLYERASVSLHLSG